MADSIANGGCCSGSVRPGTYGNAVAVAQLTVDKCGRITKISNVAITGGGGFVQPLANLVVSNSVTTTNIFASGNIYGNLSYLVNNSNYLNLLPDGTFTFPNNQIDVGSNSLTIKTQSPSGFTWDWNDGSGSLTEVNINSGGINFDVATPSLSSRWYFNPDGSTVMPNNIYVSNALTTTNVFAERYYGDGGLLSNISTFTQPLPNLVVSNSVTTTNVFATRYYGDGGLLSNISTFTQPLANLVVSNSVTTTNVFASIEMLTGSTGQTTLNVTGNMYVSNALTTQNVHVTDTLDVLGSMTANAANATFFFDTFTIPYINTQYLNVASNIVLTGNLSAPLANITTLNVQYLYANSAIIYGTSTLNVYGISNLSTTTINGGLSVSNAITTTNVFATTANVGTLNVWQISNLSTLSLTNNLYAANAVTTTNIFISSNALIGPTPTAVQANLHVEQGSVFIGNSACVGAVSNTVSISQGRLVFDNTANISVIPNRIVLYSNTDAGSGPSLAGFGVSTLNINYYTRGAHNFFCGVGVTSGSIPGFTLNSGGTVGIGVASPQAKFQIVGVGGSSNISLRVDASNVAIATTGGGLVGINTLTPTANLHVLGNMYVSNAITTTNVFAATEILTGTTGQTTLNVTGNIFASNALTTTNVFAATEILTGTTGQTTLNVTGNIFASNALTTTNVFAATETLTGTTGQTTLNVTGNLYVSNAITTTNITCAGFTSNISNTIFNYDTLTIPFISCTTLNVASTANVLTLSIPGSTGQTTLNVTGNVYASNAVTTTNVFAATETLTGSAGRTTSTITGNLYVSNALTTTNVFANTVSTVNPIPFRNRIINGAMNIWQRNTASTSTAASAYTTADRWCGALGTTNLTLTQFSGPTESPQFANALQIATTTIASGTPLIEQRIENQNITDFLNGTPVSVSFWAGQTVGTLMPLTVGLYYATAVNNFGTQTLAVAATQNTPTLTTANAYYSLSFTLTTSLGATNGLSLRFTTGGATSAGSTFLLSGVQVEKGAFATPFEVRPYGKELQLAQRYYYQLTSPTAAVQGSASVYAIFGTATGITTTAFWLPIQFPVTMRTPNYTFSNSAVSSFQLLPTGTTTITSVGLQTDSFTPVSATLNFVGTNITAGGSYIFRTNNLSGSTTAFFGFSCEL